jgi:hypothetical protein
MKLSLHLEDIKKSFQKLIQRFPLETLVVMGITALIMYSIYSELFLGWIPRALYAMIVTFFSLLAVTLYRESKEPGKWDILLPIAPIIYGIGFYFINSYVGNFDLDFGDFDLESTTFFLLHLFGFGFAILFAPYAKKMFSVKENTIRYANYFTLVFWTKLMS